MFPKIRDIVTAMRPKQWVKNLFIYAGLIFSKNLLEADLFLKVSIGFVFLCLASSGVYIFNDIKDLESDRNHLTKSKRPLASGKLKVSSAYILSIGMLAISLVGALLLDRIFLVILASYVVMNLAYSFKLKHVVIVDIMAIALSFVLRVVAGTVLADVRASDWLIICTMAVALFLGFSKRRQELVLGGSNAVNQRRVLESYSVPFLDQMIAVVTACTVISYALYTISAETVIRFGTRNLIFTIPFVLYGIFRYLYLTYHKATEENPTEMIISDGPFLLNIAFWVITVLIVIY